MVASGRTVKETAWVNTSVLSHAMPWKFHLCFKFKTVRQNVHLRWSIFVCSVQILVKHGVGLFHFYDCCWKEGSVKKWPSLGQNTAPASGSDKRIDFYPPMSYHGSWFYYFLLILPCWSHSQNAKLLAVEAIWHKRHSEATRGLNSTLSSPSQQPAGLRCRA